MRGQVRLQRFSNLVSTAMVAVFALPVSAGAAQSLNLFPSPPLLVANLVVLALLIWPVNRLLVSPLVSILQEREARTTGSTDEADAVLAQAERERDALESRRLEARRQASDRRGEILASGKAREQELIDAARRDAAASVSEVRASIDAELVQARDALRADARALAEDAAARILGRPL